MGSGCELRLNAKVTGTAKGSANKMMPITVKEKPFKSGHEFPPISAESGRPTNPAEPQAVLTR
jgi:hypothetical protein